METVDMVPNNPGISMFHCHIDDHMEAGMAALTRSIRKLHSSIREGLESFHQGESRCCAMRSWSSFLSC